MKTDVYNKPAEKISSLNKEIDIDKLKDELIRIEGTESDKEISQSALLLNDSLDKMIQKCTDLATNYSHFGKTKSMIGNFIDRTGENKELITRRYNLTQSEFQEVYKGCEDGLNSFKEEKKKFLETYRRVLNKI